MAPTAIVNTDKVHVRIMAALPTGYARKLFVYRAPLWIGTRTLEQTLCRRFSRPNLAHSWHECEHGLIVI